MKIAQITYGIGGGGAPNVAISLVKKLVKKNHIVHLIRVNQNYDNIIEKEILEKLNNNKINNFILNRKPKTFGFKSVYKLYKILKKEEYDIVHSHLLIPDIYSALVRFFLPNKFQHIITVHNSIPYHKNILLKTIFFKSIFVRCSPAINKIKSIKDDHVIPNGINLKKFNPINFSKIKIKEELNIDSNCILIVSVGNLRAQKNHIIGIKMMNNFVNKQKQKNIHYIICGDGEEKINLKNKVSDLNLDSNIHFLGIRKDIPQILYESDFFVNFSKWEGLPLAVIEALSSGIISVLSPIAEHQKIASKMPKCYMPELNDAKSFTKIFEKLISNNSSLTHEFILKQRTPLLKNYSLDSFSNSYEKLYKNYINR